MSSASRCGDVERKRAAIIEVVRCPIRGDPTATGIGEHASGKDPRPNSIGHTGLCDEFEPPCAVAVVAGNTPAAETVVLFETEQ